MDTVSQANERPKYSYWFQANINLTYTYPEELVDGEKIYYYLLNYSGDFAHGPFTIKISDGIIYLVNESDVATPLNNVLKAIQLLRPTT